MMATTAPAHATVVMRDENVAQPKNERIKTAAQG